MNKELEEFKKETLVKLKDIERKSKLDAGEYMLDSLMRELKSKPEFIEGEIVKAYFNGSPVLVGFNSLFDNDTSSFPARQGNIKNCEKIEALPMNMTKYDGTNRPDNGDIVLVKYEVASNYDFAGGRSEDIDEWEDVEEFQILKDLNP